MTTEHLLCQYYIEGTLRTMESEVRFMFSPNGSARLGLTWHPLKWQPPQTGFLVSYPGKAVADSVLRVEAAMVCMFNQLEQMPAKDLVNAYFGLWRETTVSPIYMDANQWVKKRSEAYALGKSRNQKAIWDCSAICAIPVL